MWMLNLVRANHFVDGELWMWMLNLVGTNHFVDGGYGCGCIIWSGQTTLWMGVMGVDA